MKKLIMALLLGAAGAVAAQGLKLPGDSKAPKAPARQAPAEKPQGKQEASKAEEEAVLEIVKCMVANLPENWRIAAMEINLEKPFDDSGGVRYLMARGDSELANEPFEPCDVRMPAKALIDVRKSLARDRQGWIGARVTVLRDGRYGIRYGYPQ